MATPQQPELRRSGDNAVQPGGPDNVVAAPSKPDVGGEAGPVPEDNLPGHHPDDEQDRPDPDAFVAKAREVASRKKAAGQKRPAKKAAAATGPAKRAASKAAPTGPSSGAPASSAPVADGPAPAAPTAKPDTEASAPSATKDAVAAEATLGTEPAAAPPRPPLTSVPPAAAPRAAAPRAGAGGSIPAPVIAIATFQWKVATFPVRVAIGAVGRIRRLL